MNTDTHPAPNSENGSEEYFLQLEQEFAASLSSPYDPDYDPGHCAGALGEDELDRLLDDFINNSKTK